jgi:hypothetical protein
LIFVSISCCSFNRRSYCASCSLREINLPPSQRCRGTYGSGVDKEGAADVGAVRLVLEPEGDEENAFVRDVVLGRFDRVAKVVARATRSGDDDGRITEFDEGPVHLAQGQSSQQQNEQSGAHHPGPSPYSTPWRPAASRWRPPRTPASPRFVRSASHA